MFSSPVRLNKIKNINLVKNQIDSLQLNLDARRHVLSKSACAHHVLVYKAKIINKRCNRPVTN
jgi:hypothetical protein